MLKFNSQEEIEQAARAVLQGRIDGTVALTKATGFTSLHDVFDRAIDEMDTITTLEGKGANSPLPFNTINQLNYLCL